MSAHFLSAYEIKSAELSLLALCLRTANLQELDAGLQAQLAETPGFFDQDPVLVDLSELPQDDTDPVPDFLALAQLLTRHQLRLLAFRGAQPLWRQKALAAGLVEGDDARLRQLAHLAASDGETKPGTGTQNPGAVPGLTAAASLADTAALVLDKPLRSGQQVYAKGRDLVIMAMVNPGAEVIADGHIHVYAALRGKAIAGARGWTSARIFAQAMEPELVSIAGVYRTSENPLPAEIQGRAAMVQLRSGSDGDRLLIEPLKS
jgi:septum site-determining protein MinC